MMKYLTPIFLLLFALAACSPEAAPPTAMPATPIPAPTLETDETQSETVPDIPAPETSEIRMGRTAEGAFYMGNSDAPVKMLDYSNFL